MTLMTNLPFALTMGDPSGIGPDITLQAWLARHEYNVPTFFSVADRAILQDRAKHIGYDILIKEISEPEQAFATFDHALPVLPLSPIFVKTQITPGQAQLEAAEVILQSIRLAVQLIQQGRVGAVITNPIQKSVLYQSGFSHPGHTEFLGELSKKVFTQSHCNPVMMLAAEDLRVVPATIHIPLKDVFRHLTEALLVSTAHTLVDGLQRYFACPSPRLAFTGLNPHAGENGALGNEDDEIIRPALNKLADQGYYVTGPHPADTIFHQAVRKTYDAVIAMYHDQALIPVKTIGFDTGVNITLGLPFIRTSPDHGTAYDIAGSGKANPRSLIEALKVAHHMAQNAMQRDG